MNSNNIVFMKADNELDLAHVTENNRVMVTVDRVVRRDFSEEENLNENERM